MDLLPVVIILLTLGVFSLILDMAYADRMVRSCNSILKEMEDHNIALRTEKHRLTEHLEHNIDYTNVYLTTDAFMSITHSGLLHISTLILKTSCQNCMAGLSTLIPIANMNSNSKTCIIFGSKIDTTKSYHDERLILIEQYLTTLQRKIVQLLPVVKELIEEKRSDS